MISGLQHQEKTIGNITPTVFLLGYTEVGIIYPPLPIFRLLNKNTMFSKITYHLFYQLTIHVTRQAYQISNKGLLVSTNA